MAQATNVVHLPTQPRGQPRVTSWKWNELEEDAIDELPHAAQILYLRVMRKHMDYATGIVGRVRRISYEQIKERLRYTPPRHSRDKAIEYSTDQVKKLIRKLVDVGLLERLHDTSRGIRPMEFRLPLASCDAEQQGHERATVTGPRSNPRGCEADEGNRATREPRKNAQQGHPSGSGKPYNPSPLRAGDESEQSIFERAKRLADCGTPNDELPRDYPMTYDWQPDPGQFAAMAHRRGLPADTEISTAELADFTGHFAETRRTATHAGWHERLARWVQENRQRQTNNSNFVQGNRHENRHSASQRRAEQDRIAARLANPNDDGWIDGLFEEGPTAGAGEPGVYSPGSDLSEDMAHSVQHGPDADTGQAGGRYIDGEVASTADQSGYRHGSGADQGRGRGVATQRGQTGYEPETTSGGFWDA